MQPHASARWPWALLPARLILFFLFQAVIAAGYFLTGASTGWERSVAWWPVTVTLANLVCLALLIRLYRREGRRFWDIFHFDRKNLKSDLVALLGILIISGPVAMLPNTLLGLALYGDPMIPLRLFIRPLPVWAIGVTLIFFPITQAITELPYYFRYVMPRLSEQTGRPWLGYSLASLFLGLQHLMAPLLFDWRFITWRGLMYLPFAFLVGAALMWRPRLLPYLVIVHLLIDFLAATTFLTPF